MSIIKSLRIKEFRTIEDAKREQIDSLVDDGFFTYGWFKTLESTKKINLKPFYLAAFNKDKMVAFTPCFLDIDDQFFRFATKLGLIIKGLLKIRNKLNFGQNHVLICYSPYCYRTKIFSDKNLDKKILIKKFSEKINDICKKEKILFSSFLFISQFDKDSSTNLGINGYHKFPRRTHSYYLPINWHSFEEYLSSLKYKTRKNANREIKKLHKNNIKIDRLTEFKEFSTILSRLSSNLLSRYEEKKTNYYSASFYENLNDNFTKGNAIVFVASKNNKILGYSLFLRKGKNLDGFRCGFDYQIQEKNDYAYFNLVYYSPIKWAIQEGIKKIYYRYTNDKVKIKRGCKPEKSFAFIKSHNRYINELINNLQKVKIIKK